MSGVKTAVRLSASAFGGHRPAERRRLASAGPFPSIAAVAEQVLATAGVFGAIIVAGAAR
jgi:hypothetical protein